MMLGNGKLLVEKAGEIASCAVMVAAHCLTRLMTFRLRIAHSFGFTVLLHGHCSSAGV
jgi:hypothetical protein